MSFANYDQLKAAIIRWADNDDVADRVDDFLALIHTRLNRVLRLESMGCFAYVPCIPGDAWVAKPDGYLGMRRLKIDESTSTQPLTLVPFTEIDMDASANQQGRPLRYAVAGDRFRLAPIPNAEYQLEAFYYERQPTLSSVQLSNAFLVEASDLLLYGSLLEAEPFLKDLEMFNTWKTQFARGLEDLDIALEKEKFPSGDTVARAV